MTKFARWSGIAHSVLAKSYRKIKLGHTQEILSAYFGHRTYASLRVHDLAVLQGHAKYVLTDPTMALDRASSIGFPLTVDDWHEVEMALKPSGVSGNTWLVDERSMHMAAEITFTDSPDPRVRNIGRSIGMNDGSKVTNIRCHSAPGVFPEELKFTVEGEVHAFNAKSHMAIPVVCEVVFPRVGNRFYALGELRSVEQSGPPREYEPDEPLPDYAYLSESDD
jgi:hypothetical protein